MSPHNRTAVFERTRCPFCGQTHSAELILEEMNEDTLETIREHLEENDAQYASMGTAGGYPPMCEYPLEDGMCSREVDDPTQRCWQHQNDNE